MENNNPNNIPNEEAVIARRRALAAALQRSEPVIVTPTGSVEIEGEADENGLSGIEVPVGKLA